MTQQQQDLGKTKKSASPNQQQEPEPTGEGSVYATRSVAADIARVAHCLLGAGMDGFTKKDAAERLREIALHLNSIAPVAWSEDELTQLLGRAASLKTRRFGMVLATSNSSLPSSVVLAVDPSRSPPEKAEAL